MVAKSATFASLLCLSFLACGIATAATRSTGAGAFGRGDASYPLAADPLVWLEQKISVDIGTSDEAFGAALAISGTTAVVGAPGLSGVGGPYGGAAYAFTEAGGSWSQTAGLLASDGAAGDEFGSSVAIDGANIVVGAPDSSVNGNADQGAAYVFNEVNGTWMQTQKLTASDGATNDRFGTSVAISGTTIIVGTPYASSEQGAAYVFTDSGGSWSETQRLSADDGASGDQFGTAVALSDTTALVGADRASVGSNYLEGAAYVFDESGGSWAQAAKLVPDDNQPEAEFGNAVAIDDGTALIGAPEALIGGSQNQGAAYVFANSGGTWVQVQQLTASDGGAYDQFGDGVALRGTEALVGATGADRHYGAAYEFGEASGTWMQTQKLTASDASQDSGYGYPVALTPGFDVVGAPDAAVNGLAYSGEAYFDSPADLELAVSAPAAVTQGENFVSQVIATNAGTSDSAAVAVNVPVPAGAGYVSSNASQGNCAEAADTVSCNFGAIAGNGGTATANVTLAATGNAGATIDSVASVLSVPPALTASAPTGIQSNSGGGGGGGGGGSSGGGGGGATAPLSLLLLGLFGVAALARRRH